MCKLLFFLYRQLLIVLKNYSGPASTNTISALSPDPKNFLKPFESIIDHDIHLSEDILPDVCDLRLFAAPNPSVASDEILDGSWFFKASPADTMQYSR